MSLFSFLFSPSNKYDVRKIAAGMTKDQVRNIFGRPKTVRTPGSFCAETWEYTVPFRIYATVDFDRDGIVKDTYRSGEPVE